MLSLTVRKIFTTISTIVISFGCMSFAWDKKSDTFVISPRVFRLHKKIFAHRLVVLLLLFQELSSYGSYTSLPTKIQNWMAIMILSAGHSYLHLCFEKCHEIVHYINGLLQFARLNKSRWTEKKRGFMQRMLLKLTHVMIPATFVFPAVYVFGGHWENPQEKVSLLGYMFIRRDTGILPKVIIFLLNYAMCLMSIFGLLFGGMCIQALCTVSLRDYLHMSRNTATSRLPMLYRQIQVLASMHNSIQQGIMMGFLLVLPVILFPCSITMIIRFSTENNLLVVLFLWRMMVTTMVVMLFVEEMANVCTDSEDIIRTTRKTISSGAMSKKKWFERFLRSCDNQVKIKFMESFRGHVKPGTPLTCLEYAVSYTVQLLLLEV